MNIAKVAFDLIVAAVIIAVLLPRSRPPNPKPPQLDPATSFTPPDSPPPSSTVSEAESPSRRIAPPAGERSATHARGETPAVATNKLERLTQIRETFRALAAGDRTAALRAAKQITDETERETALFTLVTEWTKGELSPPRRRASAIDTYGLTRQGLRPARQRKS